jgi:hypothetical protein
MSLWIALDSTSELVSKDKTSTLTLTITDSSGSSASIELPAQTPALAFHEGSVEHIDDLNVDVWKGMTPLGDLRVGLADIQGVDLSAVESLKLSVDGQASGALMLAKGWLER